MTSVTACTARAERLQLLGRRRGSSRRMPAMAAALSSAVPPASASPVPIGLLSTSTSPGRAPDLAEHRGRVDDALHGQPEDRLGVADRVPAGDGAAGLGDHCRRSVEDRDDRLTREVLGERGDVDRHHHPAAHREHVAARVGRGDRTEVARDRRPAAGRSRSC